MRNPFIKKKKDEAAARRIAREEYEKVCETWTRRFNIAANTVALYTLHKRFGFGRERLMRFLSACQSVQAEQAGKYEEADLYAMKETLRELGIDIDTLIGKMMDDNSSAYTGVE